MFQEVVVTALLPPTTGLGKAPPEGQALAPCCADLNLTHKHLVALATWIIQCHQWHQDTVSLLCLGQQTCLLAAVSLELGNPAVTVLLACVPLRRRA